MAHAVEKLEHEFADWLGAAGAVATGFGRSALVLALESVPVRGCDVLVPNFVCAQVPEAVRRIGGRPVFYPMRRDLSVNFADFQAAITPRTCAAVLVHYFGRLLRNFSTLVNECRKRRIAVIEDCALTLGASQEGCPRGISGDLAVFSFTKSDWCYGGGIVASRQMEVRERMRAFRHEKFRRCETLCLRYGWLRRADFAANRPSLCTRAERTGRWLDRLTGTGGNFYDAGRFDALMPTFAARRARRILTDLSRTSACRRRVLQELTEALRDAGVLFDREEDPDDTGSSLLLACSAGAAEAWRKQAAREHVTLRRCWPAYQQVSPDQETEELRWLADRLLLLEIHPRLTPAEVTGTAEALRQLAAIDRT